MMQKIEEHKSDYSLSDSSEIKDDDVKKSEEFIAIVKKSSCMSELMINLGYLSSTGRSREPVKQHCIQLGLTIQTLQLWLMASQ